MTLVTLMTLEYSLFLQGISSSIRLAPAPYTSCGTDYSQRHHNHYCPGTNPRTFSLPRAWITDNVMLEHFQPLVVRWSVWV